MIIIKKICFTSTYKREEFVTLPIISKISKCKLENNSKIIIKDAFLTEEQIKAVSTALFNPISIITGGPGTGKLKLYIVLSRSVTYEKLDIMLVLLQVKLLVE